MGTMKTVDVLIIGGGAVGCAIADALAPFASVILLEKNNAAGDEQSGRNSGVIHAGLYYKPGSLAARLCVEGNQLLYDFCSKNEIPHRRVGKIIVCQEGEESILEALLRNSQECGASDVSIIPQAEIKKREPHVVASAALLSPSTGIVQAAAYVQCLAQRAADKEAHILTNTKAVEIEPVSDGFIVSTNSRGSCKASLLINAAGLYADVIASPGLTASLAIGRYVRQLVQDIL